LAFSVMASDAPEIDEEILRFLKEHPSRFISGETISHRLNLTRTSVWKRVRKLRTSGYVIEAYPRTGYRLVETPDLLLPSEIQPIRKTRWMGNKVHYFKRIDSTNSLAYHLALQGAGEGEVVIAEFQEKGRGRLGRHWISPPFLNLYFSVILRPPIPPHQAPLMTFLAAVATADAIWVYSGLRPTIKWPNDLMFRERKIAGLLNEIHSETDHVHFVVLGIGVNLNAEEGLFPEELRNRVTSLKQEMGQAILRKEFVSHLLSQLENWYETFLKDGTTPILNAWKERATLSGRRVTVTSFGDILEGCAMDIDSDGALLLKLDDGRQKRVVAGDVRYGDPSDTC